MYVFGPMPGGRRGCERFPVLAALSVPYPVRTPVPPVENLRRWAGDRFNWMLHFQQPGVAEAELDADVARSLRLITYGLSGDAGELGVHLITGLPSDAVLLDEIPEPPSPLPWLAAADLRYYIDEYERTGFTGALSRYRNADRDWHELPAVGATTVTQPALFIGGALDAAVRYANVAELPSRVPNLVEPITLDGCGHWIQQERPGEVTTALVDFLGAHR